MNVKYLSGASRSMRPVLFFLLSAPFLSMQISLAAPVAPASKSCPVVSQVTSKNNAAASNHLSGQAYEANGVFRADYAELRSAILHDLGPVIITEGGKAILLDDGKRQEEAYIPELHPILKTIDHMALATFVILEPSTHAVNYEVKSSTINTLKALQKEIVMLRKSVKETNAISASSIVRQLHILDTTDEFINRVIAAGYVTKSQLFGFCRGLVPSLMANAYDDVVIELNSLNKIISKWLDAMPAEKRKKVCVIEMDVHMAHKDNRVQQYFLKVLGEKEEGNRFVYVESCCDEKQALELLATHKLDSKIGEAFFRDPNRMHRDLMAGVAKIYLERHTVASAH